MQLFGTVSKGSAKEDQDSNVNEDVLGGSYFAFERAKASFWLNEVFLMGGKGLNIGRKVGLQKEMENMSSIYGLAEE